ncbi:MAG: glycosyltransferase family 1 protein [Rhodohalobacter sp.]|uniref:glycosyltransferase family 4 protein n=1 Tax=Rhodohalobacter sp. TaxID=1974210 RepID=UPI003975A3AF
MRISFEASSLKKIKPTGVSRYIENLVGSMLDSFSEDSFSLYYKLSRIKNRNNILQFNRCQTKYYYNYLWPVFKDADIFHGLDGYVPNWKNVKKIVTIHDIASIKLNREKISSQKFMNKKLSNYNEVLKYVDAVVTVSESTKNDVAEYFNYDYKKIFVTHLGVGKNYYPRSVDSVSKILSKFSIDKNYLLFIGDLSARKNTTRMIKAYASSQKCKDMQFVFSGGVSYGGESSLQEIKNLGLERNVKILNYVDNSDLPALYTGASGLVFPTLYEGFGLPILESMACGTPVLTSNVGSAPEIGGKLAIYVDPYDIGAIADGIDALVNRTVGPREDLINHANKFSWSRCAEKTFEVYRGGS